MGWLIGWSYRKQVLIGGVQGAGTDYVVRLVIAENFLTDGSSVHLSLAGQSASFPSAKNESGDIRVTTSDGTTLCPLWVERVTGSSPNRIATLWVKVPVSLDNDQVLFVYYGNSQATNVSDGNSVFLLFDDFDGSSLDTNKWETSGQGSYSIQNSLITLTTSSNVLMHITSVNTFLSPIKIMGLWTIAANPYHANSSVNFNIANGVLSIAYGDGLFYYNKYLNSVWSTIQSFSRSYPNSTPFTFKIIPNHCLYFENFNQVNSVTQQNVMTQNANGSVSVGAWNGSCSYHDYIAVMKAIDSLSSVEPTPVKVSNIVETQDGAPLIPRFYPELSRASIARSTYFDFGQAARVGDGVIRGSVKRLGVPARRRVTLLDRRSMRPVQVVWSDADGNYRFDNVDRNFRYLVVCDDYAQEYNAAVADWVEPE